MTTENNPAVEAAKELRDEGKQDIIVLSTGYEARITAVGANLIDDICARIKDPPVPTFFNESKGRDEENPVDPGYIEALAQAQRDRAAASMDAMIMFGVDLVHPVPEDGAWLKRLRWMEKRGQFDLSTYDLDDELDCEFLFKKYIAVGLFDLQKIGRLAGFNRADVEAAARSFPGGEARDADSGVSAQEPGQDGD